MATIQPWKGAAAIFHKSESSRIRLKKLFGKRAIQILEIKNKLDPTLWIIKYFMHAKILLPLNLIINMINASKLISKDTHTNNKEGEKKHIIILKNNNKEKNNLLEKIKICECL